jgi:hypothetical protein
MLFLRCIKPVLGALAVVAAFQAVTPKVRAQEVKVTVVTILATKCNNDVDRRLECVAREVRKKEPGLTGFRVERLTCKSVKLGAENSFRLVDNQEATVVVRHGADKNNRVGLTVKPPLMGEVDYTTCCGKFLLIITRYQTKDKERLIIAVRVQPCNKK